MLYRKESGEFKRIFTMEELIEVLNSGVTFARRHRHVQGTESTTWTINHNLGTDIHAIDFLDALEAPIVPTNVVKGENQDVITFGEAEEGTADVVG